MYGVNKISPGAITVSESQKQAFRLCTEAAVKGLSFKLLPDSFYCFRAEDCGTVIKDSDTEEEPDAAEQEILDADAMLQDARQEYETYKQDALAELADAEAQRHRLTEIVGIQTG